MATTEERTETDELQREEEIEQKKEAKREPDLYPRFLVNISVAT